MLAEDRDVQVFIEFVDTTVSYSNTASISCMSGSNTYFINFQEYTIDSPHLKVEEPVNIRTRIARKIKNIYDRLTKTMSKD